MTPTFPNTTLTIDLVSYAGAWADMLRLDRRNQHVGDEQPPRLRVNPIEFNGVGHPGCQYE